MSRPTVPARSIIRQRLSEVIERHRDKAEDLRRIEAAITKITDDRIEDRVAIGRARDAVAIARGAQSEILVMQALGEELFDQPDLAAAERTLADCERRLDASRAAITTLEGEAERARSSLWLVEVALKSAVADVVAADPALAALRAEFEATRCRMSALLGALRGAGVPVSLIGWSQAAFEPDPVWVSAIERLRTDPDAALPDPPPDEPHDARVRHGRRAA